MKHRVIATAVAITVSVGVSAFVAGRASSQYHRYRLAQGHGAPHNTTCLQQEGTSFDGCSHDMPWFLDERGVQRRLDSLRADVDATIQRNHATVVGELQNIGAAVRADARRLVAEVVREELARQGCSCAASRGDAAVHLEHRPD